MKSATGTRSKSHYRQLAKSRNLKMHRIGRLTEDEAHAALVQIRFADTNGQPVCPRCRCERISNITTRRLFKCRECKYQFTVFSGTVWARSKLTCDRLMLLAAHFVTPSIGKASVTLSHDVSLNQSTAFLAGHKFREALHCEMESWLLEGVLEVDGALFGGFAKQPNDRTKRAPKKPRKCLGVLIERRMGRKGPRRAISMVVQHERELVDRIQSRLARCTELNGDTATYWQKLADTTIVKTVNHGRYFDTRRLPKDECGYPSENERSCINDAESFNARMRRAEDLFVHISGPYLDLYGAEQAWRLAHCRTSDAERFLDLLRICLTTAVSRRFKGYYQRGRKDAQDA